MGHSNIKLHLYATFIDGLKRPFSKEIIVRVETPNLVDNSFCVHCLLSLNSLSIFFINSLMIKVKYASYMKFTSLSMISKYIFADNYRYLHLSLKSYMLKKYISITKNTTFILCYLWQKVNFRCCRD